MQIGGMLIFIGVWLIILWIGSITLEMTGLERSKARFQALSALSGTGFTTREAESIINHPKRRTIVSWLIFLGNIGIVSFIIAMILYLKAEFTAPSLLHIIALLIFITVLFLIVWSGLIGKLSSVLVNLFRKRRKEISLDGAEILHQVGEYGIARIPISKQTVAESHELGNINIKELDMAVLAVEKNDKSLPFPESKVFLSEGDCLLCYGKMTDLMTLKL